MICWSCRFLIADEASLCPYCGAAVINPARALIEYPAYEEFRQNGFFNSHEEYYRNFRLPQILPQTIRPFFGQYPFGYGGLRLPQYPAAAMAMPVPTMQNPFAPLQIVGVIYPQARYSEEPIEDTKPEIETLVKDEPVLLLEQSDIDVNYPSVLHEKIEEKAETVKKTETVKASATETEKPKDVANAKKKNLLAVFGVIFAFIVPLIGLILSCVGLSKVKTENLGGKGLAVAGIILSLVTAFAYAAAIIIFYEPLLALFGL